MQKHTECVRWWHIDALHIRTHYTWPCLTIIPNWFLNRQTRASKFDFFYCVFSVPTQPNTNAFLICLHFFSRSYFICGFVDYFTLVSNLESVKWNKGFGWRVLRCICCLLLFLYFLFYSRWEVRVRVDIWTLQCVFFIRYNPAKFRFYRNMSSTTPLSRLDCKNTSDQSCWINIDFAFGAHRRCLWTADYWLTNDPSTMHWNISDADDRMTISHPSIKCTVHLTRWFCFAHNNLHQTFVVGNFIFFSYFALFWLPKISGQWATLLMLLCIYHCIYWSLWYRRFLGNHMHIAMIMVFVSKQRRQKQQRK